VADLANLRISVDSREVKSATNDLNSLSNAAAGTEQKTNGLGRAFGGLRGVLAGLGFGLIARELVTMADTFTNMQSQIRLVTNSTGELAAVQGRLFEMAQNSRVSYEGTVDLYARLARSTKNLGVSQESVLTVTDSINKALLVSGTSSAQASGSLMQLGQAFASGTLRGDELNSVMEGMPRVATMIAEGMGITVDQLKKLGAQGKLTGAEVFNAIMKMKDSVEVEAAKMPMTFGQSMTVLRNSLIQFVGSANATLGITKNLAALMALLANNLDVVAVAAGGVGVAFVALKASMGISFIASYIRSVVALQMALGATGTASAIFSAGLKMIQASFQSLTATMMANPFIAVATALVAVTTLLYSNRDAQVEVAGQTVRFGDIFLGVFELIRQGVAFVTKIFREGWASAIGSIAPRLAWLGGVFDTVFSAIGTFIKNYINTQIGVFAGLWAAVKAIFVGEDITDAFGAAFKKDYVGGFVKQVGNGVVALANLGKEANKTNEAAVNLGENGFAKAGAGLDAKKKKTKEATDALMDYYKGLVETGKYLGITNEYEIKAAMAREAGREALAALILEQGKFNAAKQLELDNEKARQDFIKGTLADLQFENSLIGMGVQEREKAIAMRALENAKIVEGTEAYTTYLAAIAEASDAKITGEQDKRIAALIEEITLMGLLGDAAILQAAKFAALTAGLQEGTAAYEQFIAKATEEAALEKTVDGLKAIKEAMQEVKEMTFDIDLEGVFGNVGKAVAGLVNVYDDFAKRQEVLAKAMSKDNKDEAGRRLAQQKSIRNEVNLYGNLAASAKGFFKEKSVGYKVMQAAETAFRAFEFAMSVKSIAMKATETAATVVAEGTKTAAQTASGASKMFSQLGIFAFPIVAAMIAVMASLGGKGGSSASPSIPSAEDMQAAQGAGSVLGDSTAKSDSINRALEIMASNSNRDLEYSNQMVTSLRSIQTSMANLSNNVARQISVSGGMFDTSGQKLGQTGSSGVFGLFASSTTRQLQDLGIDIVSSSIAEIIAGGISGNTYQVVEQVKKKSGFLGIGGGTKTTYQTTTGSIDQDVRNSITEVIASLRQGLIDGADVIGLDGAQAILDSFEVNIGRISLAGLTGQEIEEQLNAIFSKVGDQMAGALLPALTSMQQIGEGLFETFARVTREYQVVDVALRSIGKEFGAVGVASLAARSALVQMFESLDDFVEQTNFFRDNFLTEAERIAPVTRAVSDELARLGLSSITTIEQFKNAVLGLDLTSASGQQTYAALLQLAPAFKMVADYQAEIAKLQVAGAEAGIDTAKINAENAKAALEIQQKRVSMEIQLLEAQGFASEALTARRALELAAMDESLRGLQNQIYAAQDAKVASDAAAQAAKTAADEAAKIATQRTNLEIQLMEALGNSTEALAAKRALELKGMDATLRSLQEQIYAAQDAAIATQQLADAQAKATQEANDIAASALSLSRERHLLEIELMDALGNSSDALAARRALELAGMEASLQGLQKQIYAAQDAKEASAAAAQAAQAAAEEAKLASETQARTLEAAQVLARNRRDLEINLMEELGQSTEALAARREIELAAIDETLRGLQLQIYAAKDAKDAIRMASEAQAQLTAQQAQAADQALALARQRAALEIDLLEAQGKSTEALAANRKIELDGVDETLRGIKEQIFAAQDARKAAEENAAAQEIAQRQIAEAQEIAQRQIAQAAEKAAELSKQRSGLEIQLMKAQGNELAALNAQRALEIQSVDISLRGLQLQIWAAEDAAKANEELAATQAAAAEQAMALAKERQDLDIQLMEAQGNASGALAARRALELAGIDATLVGLKMQIWAVEDAIQAEQALSDARKTAQDELRSAYDRESSVFKETADKFRDLGNSLREVSKDIVSMIIGNESVSSELRSQFFSTSASARLGNQDALAALPNLAKQYADLVVDTAPDRLSMIRELSAIQNETIASALVADRQASIAERQLTALEQQVSTLINIEETAITVATAIRQLVALNGGIPAPATSTAISTPSTIYDSNQVATFGNNDNVSNEVSALRDEMKIAMFQIAKNTGTTATQLQRWDGDGLPETRDYA
jgi:tape measure domain-containing protein